MKLTLRRRIWQSLAATTFARAVQFGYVLVLVPVLLVSWGTEVYGEWMILTAIAGFGSLSNLGIVQASASEIMLAVGARDGERASKVYITSIVAVLAVVVLTLTIAWGSIQVIDLKTYFAVTLIPSNAAANTLLLALGSTVLSAFIPPFSAALSAVVGNGLSTVVGALIKIGELLAIWAVAYAGGGPALVSAMLVISIGISVAIHIVLVRIYVPWLSADLRYFDASILWRLVPSSLAQFSIFISTNTLGVQLPRVILGHLMGPTAVALFTVTITYARTARTLTSLFSQALQVEATRAFAEKEHERLIRMVRGLCQIHLWLSVVLVSVLILAGKQLFVLWTHGKIPFDLELCILVSLGFIAGSFGDAILVVLIGINRIMPVAIGHVASVVLSVTLAALLVPKWGAASMVAAMIIPELVAAGIGMLTFTRLVSLSFPEFFVSTLRLPVDMIRRELMQVTRVVCGNARNWRWGAGN